MGATGWEYFEPYQVDTSAALQRLRERVFAKERVIVGKSFSKSVFDGLLSRPIDTILSQEEKQKHADLIVQELKKISGSKGSKPKTIEELLKRQGESGTHSILDIIRVSPEPEFRAVSPLPASKLVEIFGTEKPSHAEIESKYNEDVLEEYICERWQGIYIVAYRDGLPDEIFFAGSSGD
jgi:hypothetical protein